MDGRERAKDATRPQLLRLLLIVDAEGRADRQEQSEQRAVAVNAIFSCQGLLGRAPAVCQAIILARRMGVPVTVGERSPVTTPALVGHVLPGELRE